MALNHRWVNHIATAMIFLVLFISVARLVFVLIESFWRPYKFYTALVLTPKIKADGSLLIRYTGERFRLCPTTIAEFWISRQNNEVEFRDRTPGGYAGLGKFTTEVKMKLPFPAAPGPYTYRSIFETNCGFGMFFTHQIPDADFEVVP